jgi:hypothetical protein
MKWWTCLASGMQDAVSMLLQSPLAMVFRENLADIGAEKENTHQKKLPDPNLCHPHLWVQLQKTAWL